MTATLQQWALPRLKQLLPLDDQSLDEIITYTETLPKDQAANHLSNILGDEPKALEFISGFNLRRQKAPAEASRAPSAPSQPSNHDRQRAVSPAGASGSGTDGVPRPTPRKKKPRANIHALPARQVESAGNVGSAYRKRDVDDYVPQRVKDQRHKEEVADNMALQDRPADASQLPLLTDDAGLTTKPTQSKLPPGAAGGQLTSDLLAPSPRKSAQSSRTSSPAPKTKVTLTGGTAMHGQSTALSDLDAAIRSLEVQTNPTMSASAEDNKRRQCNCMATRHPLLDIAPNCTNCGKIVCVKQGLGPCTFCGQPLLSSDEIQKVLRVLKDERGEERMKANNASQKRADVAFGKAKAYTGRDFLAQTSSRTQSPLSSAPASDVESDEPSAADKAKAHRDKLLGYQTQNAKRTTIKDEAADYDIPTSGTSMWASPAERAQQLKKQQKVLREMDWNARPDYEKRRVVASIDVVKGKVVRRMADVERPESPPSDAEPEDDFVQPVPGAGGSTAGHGAFSQNPLLKGGMIRPTARVEKGKAREKGEEKQTWRRVQMDEDDNEQWILDGGIYGNRPEGTDGRALGEEEHAFG